MNAQVKIEARKKALEIIEAKKRGDALLIDNIAAALLEAQAEGLRTAMILDFTFTGAASKRADELSQAAAEIREGK